MPDDEPEPPKPTESEGARRRTLTPEQRRFMTAARAPEEAAQPELKLSAPPAKEVRSSQEEAAPPERAEASRTKRKLHAAAPLEAKASGPRVVLTLLRIVGVLLLLAGIFFAGQKFSGWHAPSGKAPEAAGPPEVVGANFPGATADELVVQAVELERAGKVPEAIQRLLAAKQKDRSYRGILFRVGKLDYDKGSFDDADHHFQRAIASAEDIARSNFYRGLIAVRRKDLTGAQRFFETAARADPFTGQYFYHLAETLRMDHHPNEAIPPYRRARLLADKELDAKVCEFKMRLARMEAGDTPQVAAELEERRRAGTPSLDWLMTDAALNIRQGQIDAAVRLIIQARAAGPSALFHYCTEDFFFAGARQTHPQIAAACRGEDAKASAP